MEILAAILASSYALGLGIMMMRGLPVGLKKIDELAARQEKQNAKVAAIMKKLDDIAAEKEAKRKRDTPC